MSRPVTALIIMDGFGIREETYGNAIKAAGIPKITKLMQEYPYVTMGASGMDVGLPDGQMGNSEVGHTNIGAGRIVYQELTRITKSIIDGDFFTNEALVSACQNAKKNGGKLHLIGLLSDGGVHSHIDHLIALLRLAKQQGLDNAYVHGLMDGRDVPPHSGKGFTEQLQGEMDKLSFGKIATITGRYYGMDRDKRWDRVSLAYNAIAAGQGVATAPDAVTAVAQSYEKDVTDEFIDPTVILENGKPVTTVEDGDSIIFFNFRPDRARELTRPFIEPDFADFERIGGYKKVTYVCMTQFDATFKNVQVAFHPQSLDNTFGQYLAQHHKTQVRIAETEKYAHVTFFFNGGVEEPNPGEDRILIPSPKVATYDLQPQMSAPEVTEKALDAIRSGKYDVMILNYANCDMVGHTGDMDAAIAAVKTVEDGVVQLLDAILATGGSAIVTADHGNADMMIDEVNGGAFTAHTTFPVPFILVSPQHKGATLRTDGRLCDIAPTMLDMMNLPKPAEMTGKSMIVK